MINFKLVHLIIHFHTCEERNGEIELTQFFCGYFVRETLEIFWKSSVFRYLAL